ncbi:MAG: hypothetical protein WCG23_12180 [bacterium]
MEVRNRPQNLGFGSVHAKFNMPDILFDIVRKKIKRLDGIKLDSFENGRRRAIKIDAAPELEEQIHQILINLNGLGVKIINDVAGSLSRFESDKRWADKNPV